MFVEYKIEPRIIAVSTLDYEKKFFKVEIYENNGLVRDYPGLHKGQLVLMREFTDDMVAHPEGALVHTRNWIKKLARTCGMIGDEESKLYWAQNIKAHGVPHKECRFFFDHPRHGEVLKDFYYDVRGDQKVLTNYVGRALTENGITDLNKQWAIAESLHQIIRYDRVS